MGYKGWLIYDEAGFKRNKWFAEHLLEGASEYGLELELKVLPTEGAEYRELPTQKQEMILGELLADVHEPEQTNGIGGACSSPCRFAIVRVIAPKLSLALEQKGIRLFNNSVTARIANDKWLTYRKALEWDIPVLDTGLADTHRMQEGTEPINVTAGKELDYPQIIKATTGHGGHQVYWASDAGQKKAILQELFRQGVQAGEIIYQKPCSNPGKDMRVYVLGGEIYCAVLRSSDRDFRSNFSLGGEIALAEPTQEQERVIKRLYEKLHFDFAGIDFIIHEGEWILNEIEDVVGTRMIYQLTDKDPVRNYLAYIRIYFERTS